MKANCLYNLTERGKMAIKTAKQRGSSVYVYDEKNNELFAKSGKLFDYTSTGVTIIKNKTFYIYDSKGKEIDDLREYLKSL